MIQQKSLKYYLKLDENMNTTMNKRVQTSSMPSCQLFFCDMIKQLWNFTNISWAVFP